VISVKSGSLERAHVRELVGAVKREDAAGGVLLTLRKPTRAMEVEAAKAGFVESHFGRHPKIQIVTAEHVLAGRGVEVPGAHIAGLKRARRASRPHEPSRIPGIASTRAPVSARLAKES
jgi:site-specific DNA-methyltransferase (adenine-specific)